MVCLYSFKIYQGSMVSINCGLGKIENDYHVLACAYAAIFLHNELANEGERSNHKKWVIPTIHKSPFEI